MGIRVLVTGAAGFIGTNFLKRMRFEPEWEIVGVFHQKKPVVQAPHIHYLQADLSSFENCKQVVEGVDWVCHFAGRLSTTAVMGKNPLGPVTLNTVITAQMLEAALEAGVKKFLWLSSTTGYPQLDRPLKEEDFFDGEPPSPYGPVGWQSRFLEKLSFLYTTKPQPPMTVIVLRPSNIFGPYDDFEYATCHAITAIMRRVMERTSPIEIWGTGQDARDYLYVDDLIDACLLALKKVDGFGVFNIGVGKTYSLNYLLTLMLEIEGCQDLDVVHRLEKSGHTLIRQLDCNLAANVLGFRAKTPIKIGLAQTIRWFKEEKNN